MKYAIVLMMAACAGSQVKATDTVDDAAANAVAATDRSDDDRKLDAGRKPAAFLTFAGVKSGMRVADLGSGRGYTTELIARIVGPSGVVFAQNSPTVLQKIGAQPWIERLQQPVNKNVVRVEREFDEPLPPEANNLDVVVLNAFYHDTVWLKTDRAKMNATIFALLKHGGSYVVSDSSAIAGSGDSAGGTLHRIDEQLVRKEIEAAGFKLAAESALLRNAADTRDWSSSPRESGERRGTQNRFLLRYVKP